MGIRQHVRMPINRAAPHGLSWWALTSGFCLTTAVIVFGVAMIAFVAGNEAAALGMIAAFCLFTFSMGLLASSRRLRVGVKGPPRP